MNLKETQAAMARAITLLHGTAGRGDHSDELDSIVAELAPDAGTEPEPDAGTDPSEGDEDA